MKRALCRFPTCPRGIRRDGLCAAHLRQQDRGETLSPIPTPTPVPVEAMRLERFNGEAWELFGDVIGAD